jgi:hypothetical protein
MPRDLREQIEKIELAGVVRAAGVEVQNRGGRWVGLCPFHSEKTPSFQVHQDSSGKWRFRCWGCGVNGDLVDFVQRRYGLDFKGALNHLGIRQGTLTRTDRRKIAEANKKLRKRHELVSFFREWERAAIHHFSVMVRATYKAMAKLTPQNFNRHADILQPLSIWEYWLDILISGDDSEKFSLFQEHRKNGIKLLQRNRLFRPDFDFQRWLQEKDRIHE